MENPEFITYQNIIVSKTSNFFSLVLYAFSHYLLTVAKLNKNYLNPRQHFQLISIFKQLFFFIQMFHCAGLINININISSKILYEFSHKLNIKLNNCRHEFFSLIFLRPILLILIITFSHCLIWFFTMINMQFVIWNCDFWYWMQI